MRTDSQVNKVDCLILHYPAVEEIIGISSARFISMIKRLQAGITSGVIREFNSADSNAEVVKKGKGVIRRRAIAIFLDILPKELKYRLIKGM